MFIDKKYYMLSEGGGAVASIRVSFLVPSFNTDEVFYFHIYKVKEIYIVLQFLMEYYMDRKWNMMETSTKF